MNDKTATRFWAKVDLLRGDGCWLWKAATNNYGYGVFWLDGKAQVATRIIMNAPPGLDVDHKYTCPKNCVNPAHLRLTTRSQNNQNFAGPQSNSKSGIRGVWWDKRRKRWAAQVAHEGRTCHVGYFNTASEAENAVRLRRIELHSHNDLDRIRG